MLVCHALLELIMILLEKLASLAHPVILITRLVLHALQRLGRDVHQLLHFGMVSNVYHAIFLNIGIITLIIVNIVLVELIMML
jgi:hypothetical protein